MSWPSWKLLHKYNGNIDLEIISSCAILGSLTYLSDIQFLIDKMKY